MTIALNDAERALAMSARAYVTSKFYPPLPVEYGDLAIIALREYREYGPEAPVDLPEGLNPLPKGATRDTDGDLIVAASELIRALRIEHMLEEDLEV